MNNEITTIAKALHAAFDGSEIPKNFSFNGQTFFERCEAWAMHALEQLEDEIDAQGDGDDGEDDKE